MSTTGASGPSLPGTEGLLQRASAMVASARALPLSSSAKLDNKEEVLELLREAVERLPDELRQARWMLKEREEYLATTKRRAEELVEAARSEAQRLVQRTEILKEAQSQARRVVEEARDEARRLRLEAEDYADQRLAQFEIILERTLRTVSSGRQKLSGLTEQAEPGQKGSHRTERDDLGPSRSPASAADEGAAGHAVGAGPGEGGPTGWVADDGPSEEGVFDQDFLG